MQRRVGRFGTQTHERTQSESAKPNREHSKVDLQTQQSMLSVVGQLKTVQKPWEEEKKVEVKTDSPSPVPSLFQAPPPVPPRPQPQRISTARSTENLSSIPPRKNNGPETAKTSSVLSLPPHLQTQLLRNSPPVPPPVPALAFLAIPPKDPSKQTFQQSAPTTPQRGRTLSSTPAQKRSATPAPRETVTLPDSGSSTPVPRGRRFSWSLKGWRKKRSSTPGPSNQRQDSSPSITPLSSECTEPRERRKSSWSLFGKKYAQKPGVVSEPSTPVRSHSRQNSLSLADSEFSTDEPQTFGDDRDWQNIYSHSCFDKGHFDTLIKYIADELGQETRRASLPPIVQSVYQMVKNAYDQHTKSEGNIPFLICLAGNINDVTVATQNKFLLKANDILNEQIIREILDLAQEMVKILDKDNPWHKIYTRSCFTNPTERKILVRYVAEQLPSKDPLINSKSVLPPPVLSIYRLIVNTYHQFKQQKGMVPFLVCLQRTMNDEKIDVTKEQIAEILDKAKETTDIIKEIYQHRFFTTKNKKTTDFNHVLQYVKQLKKPFVGDIGTFYQLIINTGLIFHGTSFSIEGAVEECITMKTIRAQGFPDITLEKVKKILSDLEIQEKEFRAKLGLPESQYGKPSSNPP